MLLLCRWKVFCYARRESALRVASTRLAGRVSLPEESQDVFAVLRREAGKGIALILTGEYLE